jgi:hypothetical protein
MLGGRRGKYRRRLHGRIFSSWSFLGTFKSISFTFCRLVTLRSCLLDNEKSLAEVVDEIHKILEKDPISPLVSLHAFLLKSPLSSFIFGLSSPQKREISEREVQFESLREQSANLQVASEECATCTILLTFKLTNPISEVPDRMSKKTAATAQRGFVARQKATRRGRYLLCGTRNQPLRPQASPCSSHLEKVQ